MKPTKPELTQISLCLTTGKLKQIDRYAEQWGISRIELFRRALFNIPKALLEYDKAHHREMLKFVVKNGVARNVYRNVVKPKKVRRTKTWKNDLSGV